MKARWNGMLLGLLAGVGGIRIPLDTQASGPFLQSSMVGSQGGPYTSKILLAPFTWSNVYLGKLLHGSSLVEVGPRGVRFILYQTGDTLLRREQETVACLPSSTALCAMPNGDRVLPSFVRDEVFPVASTAQNPQLKQLAESQGCDWEGKGIGRYFAGTTLYTVTACDVVQGTHGILYEKNRMSVYEQTFGPLAYLVILISATINVTALGSPMRKNEIALCNAALGIVACLLVHLRGLVHFYTLEDEMLFLGTCACGLGYLVLLKNQPEGYTMALSCIASTLYRTQETPYAPIIAYVMGYQVWVKIHTLCHGHLDGIFLSGPVMDLLVSLVFTVVFCEISLKPQCLYPQVWPIYFLFHFFLCFCLVKYQELCQASPL